MKKIFQRSSSLWIMLAACVVGWCAEVAPADRLKEIEENTSKLRQLAFKQPVTYKTMERAKLRDYLVLKVKEQYTEQEMRDYGRTMETLGLIPPGTDLMSILLSMYDEQVAAFYVPEEHSLYTFAESTWTGNVEKMLLAHELTHALQDQNFDLLKFPLKEKNNDDLAMATAALIEGDATVLMTQYYAEHADPANALKDMGSILGQNTAKLSAAPPFLRNMLLFPYEHGLEFATAVIDQGGMRALNEAYRHPPKSTKEILHPETYLHDRRDITKIELPRIATNDWRLIGNNVLGEFGIREMLVPHLGLFRAKQAAQGWNGDRYHVYELGGAKGPTGLVWISAWETEDDAIEFEDTYNKVLTKRNQPKFVTKVVREGDRVKITGASDSEFFKLAVTK